MLDPLYKYCINTHTLHVCMEVYNKAQIAPFPSVSSTHPQSICSPLPHGITMETQLRLQGCTSSEEDRDGGRGATVKGSRM